MTKICISFGEMFIRCVCKGCGMEIFSNFPSKKN